MYPDASDDDEVTRAINRFDVDPNHTFVSIGDAHKILVRSHEDLTQRLSSVEKAMRNEYFDSELGRYGLFSNRGRNQLSSIILQYADIEKVDVALHEETQTASKRSL